MNRIYFFSIKKLFKCKKNAKEKILQKSTKLLNKELDVLSILSRIHEIEKIKLVIFNQDQLVLFDSISKPLVRIDEKEEQKNITEDSSPMAMSKMIKEYKSMNHDEIRWHQCYKNVRNAQDDEINRRLLQIIGKN